MRFTVSSLSKFPRILNGNLSFLSPFPPPPSPFSSPFPLPPVFSFFLLPHPHISLYFLFCPLGTEIPIENRFPVPSLILPSFSSSIPYVPNFSSSCAYFP